MSSKGIPGFIFPSNDLNNLKCLILFVSIKKAMNFTIMPDITSFCVQSFFNYCRRLTFRRCWFLCLGLRGNRSLHTLIFIKFLLSQLIQYLFIINRRLIKIFILVSIRKKISCPVFILHCVKEISETKFGKDFKFADKFIKFYH